MKYGSAVKHHMTDHILDPLSTLDHVLNWGMADNNTISDRATTSLLPYDFTNCPSCQNLCVSPTILTCGHLLCRKCLRHILEHTEHKAACPFCSHTIHRAEGQTISNLADQLGRDIILEDLVMKELAGQGQVFCMVCTNNVATRLCADCGEIFCDCCSKSHEETEATNYHLQQNLPHTLSASESSSLISKAKRRLISVFEFPPAPPRIGSAVDLPSVDLPPVDLSPVDLPPGISTTIPSPGSVPASVPQDNTRYDYKSTDQASLDKESSLFRERISLLNKAAEIVRNNIAGLQEVERRLETQRQVLNTYFPRLDRPDDVILSNARTLLPRLKNIRLGCRPPPTAALISLTRLVNTLKQCGSRTGGISYDPMTSSPIKKFLFKPDAASDTHKNGPLLSSIQCTDDYQLVMLDTRNKTVKMTNLDHPAKIVPAVQLDAVLLRLTLLSDGVVAVTAYVKRIYFVDVTETPSTVSHVETKRQYIGIGSGMDKNRLVCSCGNDGKGPSTLDVLTRSGVVLMSITGGDSLPNACWPHYLYVQDQLAWISDWKTHAVHKVELDTGRLIGTYKHSSLKCPCQVVVDKAGHCYVACESTQYVLVLNPAGQWRKLLHGPENSGDETRIIPCGVCVTDWGVVVTWDGMKKTLSGPGSVVSGYDLV